MRIILRKLLHPGRGALALLTVLSASLLIVALQEGRERSILSYAAYALSAYTLTALCIRLPKLMGWIREASQRCQTKLRGSGRFAGSLLDLWQNDGKRAGYLLNLSLLTNLAFAVFKLAFGVWSRSFWLGALGVYYAVLALMRFSLARSVRKADAAEQLRLYRRTAWRLNLLTLVMSGVFVQMVIQNRAYRYPGILIYVMAIWAFAKIITATVALIRKRGQGNPILGASRSLSFACALMSILALQTAMIAEFGDGSGNFAQTANAIAGGVITLLMITLSVLMILRSRPKSINQTLTKR